MARPSRKKSAKRKISKPRAVKTSKPSKKRPVLKAVQKNAPRFQPVAVKPPPVKTAPVISMTKFLKLNPSFVPLLRKLQDRKYQITGQVGSLENDLKDDMAENQNVPGDLADHGSGELNQHLSVTLMENERIELERIDHALQRFEDVQYGRCEVCERSIPMMRLKAIPWATRCINCQSRAENG